MHRSFLQRNTYSSQGPGALWGVGKDLGYWPRHPVPLQTESIQPRAGSFTRCSFISILGIAITNLIGKRIATASDDGTVKLWNISEYCPRKSSLSIAFSGLQVVLSASDGSQGCGNGRFYRSTSRSLAVEGRYALFVLSQVLFDLVQNLDR